MARPMPKYYPALDKIKTHGVRGCELFVMSWNITNIWGRVQGRGCAPSLGTRVSLLTQWAVVTGLVNYKCPNIDGRCTKMGWQCVPQLTGLVRGEPQPGQKHRSNGKAILGELGKERHSASATLDRSRSHLNSYDGFDGSGFACWDDMFDRAGAYRVKVNTKAGVKERALREDAVIGCAVIFEPPVDMMTGWTAEECDRFFDDCRDCMAEIEPKLFRPANRRMQARHRDEGYKDLHGEYGEHEHDVYDAIDQNGRYCGNLIDAALRRKICESFPRLMRARNWDLEDCDLTDFARMGFVKDAEGNKILDDDGKPIPVDPAYRKERQEKRKRQGRSANQYAADRKAAAHDEAAKLYEAARLTERDARRERHEIRAEANEYARKAKAKADHDADEIRAQATRDAEAIREAAKKDAEDTAAEAARQAEAVQVALRQRVKASLAEAKQERDQAIADRDSAQTARRATVAALQGDYEEWATLTPRPSANKLLGILGAAMAASRKPPNSSGIGRAWAELQRRLKDSRGPAAPGSDGPTLG